MLSSKKYILLSAMAAFQVFGLSASDSACPPAVNWSIMNTLKCVPSLVAKIAKIPVTHLIKPVCSFYRYSPHPKTKIVGVVAALAVAKATRNYAEVRALDKKRNYEHDLLGDRSGVDTKFYKWNLKKWCSARTIKQNGFEVWCTLETDLRLHKIKIPGVERPDKQDILRAIKAEKEEFWQDIEWLEENHVVYLDCMPSLFDACGIKSDYKNACAQAPFNNYGERACPESPGSWTAEQEKYINMYMENPWWNQINSYGSTWDWVNTCMYAKDYAQNVALNAYRPFFKIIKPNYSYAAKTYWKLYTSWQRLKELEELVERITRAV